MKQKKNHLWPWLYGAVLTVFTVYVLLDTFVIPRSYAAVEQTQQAAQDIQTKQSETVTDSTYDDGNTQITLTKYRQYDTDIYVADITLSSVDALKTAFANNTYGKNITQTTSVLAENQNAVLAINGDYYSARSGYVIRNGVLYRSDSDEAEQQDLVIQQDGSFKLIQEGQTTAQQLLDDDAWQVLSFGPALVDNGTVCVDANAEVDKAKTSNPRTAIAYLGDLHYVMVVADGRTSQSTGLSLYQLAAFLQQLGVQTAYNLDGGGSSTMVFNGKVVNNPTTDGKRIEQRKVSDIVYIG